MNGSNNTSKRTGILFLGDSFTWGEGLELYCDTPKWVEERSQKNTWKYLSTKQDTDGEDFREKNRYPGIVSKHFNTNVYVDDHNGGYIGRYL